jgi:hypothetical protein
VVSATTVAETNRARFMEIVDCAAKDPVMAAQAWPLLRRERDTTVLQMTGMFWRHRDDSSEPARVRSAAACVVARLVPPE